jgi:hypothetical protein
MKREKGRGGDTQSGVKSEEFDRISFSKATIAEVGTGVRRG